ncbi:hypothetical protein SLA2020_011330 [Shorea laevis]
MLASSITISKVYGPNGSSIWRISVIREPSESDQQWCTVPIIAIESYGSKLFLGCSDRSLRIYAPDFSGAELSSSPSNQHVLRKEQYALERTVVGFSKKPIVSNYCSVLLLYVR